MRKTARLNVVGTFYNQAKEAYFDLKLSDNAPIKLVAEVENSHDKNAVAVFSDNYKYKLGHINKELAPKYQKLVLENKIISCSVFEASTISNSVKLQISITYEEEAKKAINSAVFSAENKSGVYKIQLGTNKKYIGSTTNLKTRFANHLKDLQAGHHHNRPMQIDFNALGEAKLIFEVIMYCSNKQIKIKEEQAIQSALKKNESLYSMTPDGQGYFTGATPSQSSISERPRRHTANKIEYKKAPHIQTQKREIDGTKTDEGLEAFKAHLNNYLNEMSSVREREHYKIEQALQETFLNRFRAATKKNPGYEGRRFIFGRFGFGREFFENGDCYAGNHQTDKRHGHGTYRWASGNTYAGNWIKSERTGLGCFSWKNGDVYEGEWVNGQMHGYGSFVSNSEKYWGIWSYGKLVKKS